MRLVLVLALASVALSAAVLVYAIRRDAAAGFEGFIAGALLILSLEQAFFRWLTRRSRSAR